MNLKQKIKKDINQALKKKKTDQLSFLRFLQSQINDQEIEQKRKELTDEQVIEIINNQIKKIEESLDLFKKGKRKDLASKAEQELAILQSYLPPQLSDQELEKEINQIIAENPALPHPGALIGIAVKKLAGKADNKRISQLIMQKTKK
jgi:uncharacterized protein YqeY